MHAMHQTDSTQEYIQCMWQIVIQGFDRAVSGIFAVKKEKHVIENASEQMKIIVRIEPNDNCGRLFPHNGGITVSEQVIDFACRRITFHAGQNAMKICISACALGQRNISLQALDASVALQ